MQKLFYFEYQYNLEFLLNVFDFQDFLSVLDFQKFCYLRSFYMKEVKDIVFYIIRCFVISWEMVVQDLFMYLQFKIWYGIFVDWEKYNFYIIEGDVVDYFVWFVVLREENGVVFQKGKVQVIFFRFV